MSGPSMARPGARRAVLGLGAATATAALMRGPTSTARARPDAARLDTSAGQAGAAAALAQEYGISTATAHRRLESERGLDRLSDALTRQVGVGHTGGAYIARSGALVVTVT